MAKQLSMFPQTPRPNIIGTSGQKAVSHGARAEDVIADLLSKSPYKVYRQVIVGKNIYGHAIKVDFLIYGFHDMEEGLIIEVKWQSSPGTTDEKLPYLVENIYKHYPHPTVVVLAGGGYREGAAEWLKKQVDGRKLVGAYSIEEFVTWIMKYL